jgi:alkylated DNA repair dioxygenase AlkB
MQGSTQHHWLHSIPKQLKITTARINLTFRIII